jgi:hypothetical protein
MGHLLLERLELGTIPGARFGDFYGINGFVLPDCEELYGSFPDRYVDLPARLKLHFTFGHSTRSAGILLERVEYLHLWREEAEVLRLERSHP